MAIAPGYENKKVAAANAWEVLLDNPLASPAATLSLQKVVACSLESGDLDVDFAIVKTGQSRTAPPDAAMLVKGQRLEAGEYWDVEALRGCFVPSVGAVLVRSTKVGLALSVSWIRQD